MGINTNYIIEAAKYCGKEYPHLDNILINDNGIFATDAFVIGHWVFGEANLTNGQDVFVSVSTAKLLPKNKIVEITDDGNLKIESVVYECDNEKKFPNTKQFFDKKLYAQEELSLKVNPNFMIRVMGSIKKIKGSAQFSGVKDDSIVFVDAVNLPYEHEVGFEAVICKVK